MRRFNRTKALPLLIKGTTNINTCALSKFKGMCVPVFAMHMNQRGFGKDREKQNEKARLILHTLYWTQNIFQPSP